MHGILLLEGLSRSVKPRGKITETILELKLALQQDLGGFRVGDPGCIEEGVATGRLRQPYRGRIPLLGEVLGGSLLEDVDNDLVDGVGRGGVVDGVLNVLLACRNKPTQRIQNFLTFTAMDKAVTKVIGTKTGTIEMVIDTGLGVLINSELCNHGPVVPRENAVSQLETPALVAPHVRRRAILHHV